jgi:hypothetical protein
MRKVTLMLLGGCMLRPVKSLLMQHVDSSDRVGFHVVADWLHMLLMYMYVCMMTAGILAAFVGGSGRHGASMCGSDTDEVCGPREAGRGMGRDSTDGMVMV